MRNTGNYRNAALHAIWFSEHSLIPFAGDRMIRSKAMRSISSKSAYCHLYLVVIHETGLGSDVLPKKKKRPQLESKTLLTSKSHHALTLALDGQLYAAPLEPEKIKVGTSVSCQRFDETNSCWMFRRMFLMWEPGRVCDLSYC